MSAGLEDLELEPDDDAAPGSVQPVVRMNEDGERQIELMRWGFKMPDKPLLLFNARSEGIEKANFWKAAFEHGRCIVPADAVYEWQKQAAKQAKKPKFEIVLKGQHPFGMAGVWKRWRNPKTEEWENTFAVLTGEPNEAMEGIHPRMTTFLEPGDYAEYLAESERPPVHLLRIVGADEVRVREVGRSPITNKQVGLFDPQ